MKRITRVGRPSARVNIVPAIAAVTIAALIATAGCGVTSAGKQSGGTNSKINTDLAKLGRLTLVEWDQQTEGTESAAQNAINRAFEQRYPNIRVKRVAESFSDLKTTLRLALSGKHPPAVVQANQGYPDMGQYVQAKLLEPLNNVADVYRWYRRYTTSELAQNRFSSNGKVFGAGNLYGLSQSNDIVGLYYNKRILGELHLPVPATLGQFESELSAIKRAHVLPISYGDSDKTLAIHVYGFIQALLSGKREVNDLVFSRGRAKWTDKTNVEAATLLRQWYAKGFLTPDGNGVSQSEAVSAFEDGKAAFMIEGTWEGGSIAQVMRNNVGFTVLTSATGGGPVAQGGPSLAWSITSGAASPSAAAGYINFLCTKQAAAILARYGGSPPAVVPSSNRPKSGSVEADIWAAVKQVNTVDGIVPYLDYTTPDFFDVLTAQLQEMAAGQTSVSGGMKALEADANSFRKSDR